MKETHSRSILKSITWRVLATLTTMILVFIFTGDLVVSLGVGVLEAIFKIIIYYLHERTWDKIRWGRKNRNK